MMERVVIGSRGSRLARWQAEWVRSRLAALNPRVEFHIEIVRTSGDILANAPLTKIGGRGVFTKELEEALQDGRIDLAVHSLKDLPTNIPEDFHLAAITEREDPRDALVLPAGSAIKEASISALDKGSVVGTSSLRRLAQLKHLRPDLGIKDLRGNVDTRIRKLDDGEYDAIILAAAGLRRLGFEARISLPLNTGDMLPAVGQGALGIEVRAGDRGAQSLASALDHPPTRAACTAERSLLRALGGGCQLPIAGHAVTNGAELRLDGLVAGLSGETVLRDRIEGPVAEASSHGSELAERLLRRGADSLLNELA